MAGFTLSFGSMFSKTWRVHSIFTNVQLNKKVQRLLSVFGPSLKFYFYRLRCSSKTSLWSWSWWWLSGDEGLTAVLGGGSAAGDGHHHHDHLAAGGPLLQGDQRAQTICEDLHHHHLMIIITTSLIIIMIINNHPHQHHYKCLFSSSWLSLWLQPQYGDADFIIIPQNEMCKSHRMNVFIGVIYAYKGLLLVSDAVMMLATMKEMMRAKILMGSWTNQQQQSSWCLIHCKTFIQIL